MLLLLSTWIEQPVEQSGQTLSTVLRFHTRCLYKKSLLASAPTGHRSTTFVASLLFSGSPGKTSISLWLPRWITCSSAVPEISRVNRTQREHMMQRSVNSDTFVPMLGLLGGVVVTSIMRLAERP